MWKRKRSNAAEATTFIKEGCQLEGRASFSGVTVINCRLTGDDITADRLVVGREGVITAPIQAQSVTVFGRVVGDITGRKRVEIETGAHVTGNIDAPVFVLKDGGVLDGHCRTSPNVVIDASTASASPGSSQADDGCRVVEVDQAHDTGLPD